MDPLLQTLSEALQYGFIQKALLAGSMVALSCSFLGIFLVLKKFSMIGDGLAHVSFATIAIALFFGMAPLTLSIPLVVLASFVILKVNQKADMYGDAAIGLISSFSIALGVLISSLSSGFNVDLFSYLFGSILVIEDSDVWLSVVLSALILFLGVLYYPRFFALTHDEEYAEAIGLNTNRLNAMISVLTAVTIVLGIKIVGTMLISSLVIFPTVTALQFTRGFKATILISAVVSVLSVILGVFGSYLLNVPTGAAIVLLNGMFFVVALSWKRLILKG